VKRLLHRRELLGSIRDHLLRAMRHDPCAALLFSGLTFLAASSCRGADPPLPCPPRFAADGPRARALEGLLASTPEGEAILAHLPRRSSPPVCFGPAVVSAITTEGVVLFDAGLEGPEAAARLGHLLIHVTEGVPMARPTPEPCPVQVERALAAEAHALAVEIRLRRALGMTGSSGRARRIPYAFEDDFWAAPAGERQVLVLAYLHAHPDGGPGLDALASGYARRCAEGR
jgi:hypothetical protein